MAIFNSYVKLPEGKSPCLGAFLIPVLSPLGLGPPPGGAGTPETAARNAARAASACPAGHAVFIVALTFQSPENRQKLSKSYWVSILYKCFNMIMNIQFVSSLSYKYSFVR